MKEIMDKCDKDEKKMNINNNVNTSNCKLFIKYNQNALKSGLQTSLYVGFDDEKFELKQDTHHVKRFSDIYNKKYLKLESNNTVLKGIHSSCMGWWIYGEFDVNGDGYKQGIHYWSLKKMSK
eukprot:351742_1